MILEFFVWLSFLNSIFQFYSEEVNSEIFSMVPKKGEFDLNEVLSSVYFFS